MMSIRKAWFVLSLSDIAFFNVVLSHYAGTYRLLTGQGDPMESMSFTSASIKIINERLGTSDLGTSDGTIAAVAGMVLKEVSVIPNFSFSLAEIRVYMMATGSRKLTSSLM